MGKVSEKPTCLINQPAGLGDILFLQKAAAELSKNYNIVWPVLPQLEYLKDYLVSYDIQWVRHGAHVSYDKLVNFATADRIIPGPIMAGKYKLIGLDHSGWQSFLKVKRNFDREQKLFDSLNISGDFALINQIYGTPPNVACKDVPKSSLPMVNMSIIDGFTLFDWCGVIEAAKEIISVDTSINYLVDTLSITAERLVMVSRHSPPNFYHIDGLFSQNWIKH